jgi:hypothetical protein
MGSAQLRALCQGSSRSRSEYRWPLNIGDELNRTSCRVMVFEVG